MNLKKSVASVILTSLSFFVAYPSAALADSADLTKPPEEVNQAINGYATAIENSYLGKSTISGQEDSPEELLASKNAAGVTDANELLSVEKANVTLSPVETTKSGTNYIVSVNAVTSLVRKATFGTKIYIGGSQRNSFTSIWTERHTLRLEPQRGAISTSYSVTGDDIQDEYVSAAPDTKDSLPPLPNPSATQEVINNSDDFNSQLNKPLISSRAKNVDYIKEILYARKWTAAPYNGNEKKDFNPDFPYYKENCANFVSQAMYAGGLPLVGASSPFIYDTSVWTWNLSGILQASRTWSQASKNYVFMKDHSGAFTVLDNIWNAWQGSLLYTDWEGDGTIDHAMVVVGAAVKDGYGDPIIDQKSNNQHEIDLHTSIQHAAQQGHKNVKWYGLQMKF